MAASPDLVIKKIESMPEYVKMFKEACDENVKIDFPLVATTSGTMQAFQIAAKYEFIDIGGFKGDKNSMVKTPTLRNVGLTAPYFHNGAIWSLKKP